jgi:phosphohistidine phosphatase
MTDLDLILWRHADAGDPLADAEADARRRLSARGRKQAERIAGWLQARLPERHAVLASPAVRALETARALRADPRIDTRLGPDASVVDCIAALGEQGGHGGHGEQGEPGERSHCVVLVGHQPTLGRLASLLLSGEQADWSIRKGAIWWLSGRERDGRGQVVLRAVMSPDLA